MKLLIYGAGVIGCFYGSLFSEAGYDVSIYARGKRLESLKSTGLQYKNGNTVKKAKVTIVDNLPYEIDEENSELKGGIYNKEAKTITWEERKSHCSQVPECRQKAE